jgi:hypothetical protein
LHKAIAAAIEGARAAGADVTAKTKTKVKVKPLKRGKRDSGRGKR